MLMMSAFRFKTDMRAPLPDCRIINTLIVRLKLSG